MSETVHSSPLGNIYLDSGGKTTGPHTLGDVKTFIDFLAKDAMAWWPEANEWRPFLELPGLVDCPSAPLIAPLGRSLHSRESAFQRLEQQPSAGHYWLKLFCAVGLLFTGIVFVPFILVPASRAIGWAAAGASVLGVCLGCAAVRGANRVRWKRILAGLCILPIGSLGFVAWQVAVQMRGGCNDTRTPVSNMDGLSTMETAIPRTNRETYVWIHRSMVEAISTFNATANKADLNAYAPARSAVLDAVYQSKKTVLEKLRTQVVTDPELDEFLRALPAFIVSAGRDTQLIENNPNNTSENMAIVMRWQRMAALDHTLARRYGEATTTFAPEVTPSDEFAAFRFALPGYFDINPVSAEQWLARQQAQQQAQLNEQLQRWYRKRLGIRDPNSPPPPFN